MESNINSGKNNFEPNKGDLELQEAIYAGNVAKVQQIIASGTDVNRANWLEGVTPLEIAVESKNLQIVQVLLEAGAHPDFGVSSDPLTCAARKGLADIAAMLIQAGAKISIENGSALNTAAGNGHIAVVRLLIEAGANVNPDSENDCSPLFFAASEGHQEVFNYLTHLANPEQRREAQEAAFLQAAADGNTRVLELLYSAGMDLNFKSWDGKNALMWAAKQGQTQIVQSLLRLGVEVNIQDNEGKTALVLATLSQHITIIKSLINAGANINIKDLKGNTALSYAKKAKDNVIIQIFQDAGAREN